MNIKSFMALAVAALTVAACDNAPEAIEAPAAETPAVVEEAPATQPELDSGEVSPREVSEENPAAKPE